MPEPIISADGGENTPPAPPQLDEATQAWVNGIINDRLKRQETKHQTELAAAKKAADDALAAERDKNKPAPKPEGQSDAEKEQFKNILDGEKRATAAEREARAKAEKEAADYKATNAKILKDVAIRDAVADQDNFRFHNIDVVKTLTEKYVTVDEETGAFVVKDENGVVRQNSSLQPMSLKEFYAQYASQHPYLVSSNAKGGTGSGESNRTIAGGLAKVASKADLKTFKEKSDYIKKFGGEAYEQLPLK